MPLFILTETSAGYALLKAKDKKLLERDDLGSEVETAEQVCSLLKLKHFKKFDSAAEALEEVSALVESKVSPALESLLDHIKDEKKASLVVADPKLGTAISKLPQLSIKPVSDGTTLELFRSIRDHLPSLIPGLLPDDISTMSLGLSHSLSRHKLKFSPDKIDTMIVQAVALLDDLDKELNTYAMRVKEWYGWHFPEMGRIVNDNLAYARVILKMGMRSNAANADLAEVLPEEIEGAVKGAAEVSMGTEITEEDLENIQALAEQVVNLTEYRQTLSSYLSARMTALAPNLTALVGELVGARLIAHAGSLLSLAKSPASTIQILGAEKALFRALKTKHDTPKYGLIYHASLVGQATGKNKGKIARVLAAKAALGLRADAYANWGVQGEQDTDIIPEEEKAALGLAARAKIERRLASLEGKAVRTKGTATIAPAEAQQQPSKWEVKEARKYNPDADALAGDEPAAAKEMKAKHALRAKIDLPDGPKPVKKDLESEEDSDEESDEEESGSDSPAKVNGNSSSTLKSSSGPAAKLSKEEKLEKLRARKEKKRAKDMVFTEAARKVGLSTTRYKRKLERGEIQRLPDGTEVVTSKKDVKKAKKKAEKLARLAAKDGDSKKRKHAGDGEERQKKKEKKSRKTAA